MPVTVAISDANLSGLSDPARQEVKATLESFATDLISEANRLEAATRSSSAAPDVNAQMVRDASTFVRRGMTAKSPSAWTKISRVMAALLALILGVVWDKDSLQSSTYLVGFGALLVVTLVITTFVAIKD